MGDNCSIAFYDSTVPLDLSQYQFMLYRSRWGDPGSISPLIAWCLLDVYEIGGREEWAAARRQDHIVNKLCQYGFAPVEYLGEDIFQTADNIDFFYAVNSSFQIDSYISSVENFEVPLPKRTAGFLELERERERSAKDLGLEFSFENATFGLRKVQSIDLLRLLTTWDQTPWPPVKENKDGQSSSAK
jgi:predicted NUDIX family NTP pyrophosphohydrolase